MRYKIAWKSASKLSFPGRKADSSFGGITKKSRIMSACDCNYSLNGIQYSWRCVSTTHLTMCRKPVALEKVERENANS